jgi:hypothetical protein
MTPFKEIILGRQRTLCEPEIMILKPDQLISEPQVVADFDLKEVKKNICKIKKCTMVLRRIAAHLHPFSNLGRSQVASQSFQTKFRIGDT